MQRHDVNVDAVELRLPVTKSLAQEPPHAVSPHGSGNDPAADGQTEPTLARPRKDEKKIGASHFRRGGELKVTAMKKPSRLGKRSPERGLGHLLLSRRDGQALSAFLPAALQHQTAVFTGHALAETVRPLPLDTTGLVSALHNTPRDA